MLTIFLDQFVPLARTGMRAAAAGNADVTDLGLVFVGPAEEFEKFAQLTVTKADAADVGHVEVFNPARSWFKCPDADPLLLRTKDPKVAPDGVKLDWKLGKLDGLRATLSTDLGNLEQHLQHYEILAELDDHPRWKAPKIVKPASTKGGLNAAKPMRAATSALAVHRRPVRSSRRDPRRTAADDRRGTGARRGDRLGHPVRRQTGGRPDLYGHAGRYRGQPGQAALVYRHCAAPAIAGAARRRRTAVLRHA